LFRQDELKRKRVCLAGKQSKISCIEREKFQIREIRTKNKK